MVLEDWVDHRLDPPLQLPPHVIPTHPLISEQGGVAVPREKSTKITMNPESFLPSRHSLLLLAHGNGLAFG